MESDKLFYNELVKMIKLINQNKFKKFDNRKNYF